MMSSFTAKGTTNYVFSDFNIKTKDRFIHNQGGVPLHKIIDDMYDFLCTYKMKGTNSNKIYYLHIISQPISDYRPDTPYLLKLNGSNFIKDRTNNLIENYKQLFSNIDKIFLEFIKTDNGFIKMKKKYRSDVNHKQLILSFNKWNNKVKPDICNNLLN